MGKRDSFDPGKDYALETQIRDMIKGYDVVADVTSVIK